MVIAILAILAALLLPALGSAKAKAHCIGCKNNLKQMGQAWAMYTHDHADFVPLNLGWAAKDDSESWVRGVLWLDSGTPPPNYAVATDNTNLLHLQRSPLFAYAPSFGIWRCPSDNSTSTFDGVRYPRVRSISMSCMLGLLAPPSMTPAPWKPWLGRVARRTSDIRRPAPAECFVFLDEREDSIDSSFFLVLPDGLPSPPAPAEPPEPAGYGIADYPGSYHNNGGNFCFGDDHVETHKWVDERTRPPLVKDSMLPRNLRAGTPTPFNPDVQWLQEHSCQKTD